ncbi:MAG: UDP-N-acetylmuramate--L-alanine ligase [Lachnospiraceae bacterium]|nr:UDP-N-acetylmuramate--L-alanine ligase [Lachnospiraceae bacterium]
MFELDYQHPVHLYFIGIGGISMSGIAELLHSKGFTISGSDRSASDITEHLQSIGVPVNIGQCRDNIVEAIKNGIDYAVYTAAIHKDNPEYAACVELGIELVDRADLLGQISRKFPVAIGVSGTHGKTTTTSMLAMMLIEAGLDPTVSLGGKLDAINGNIRIGRSDRFLFEACEYTNSFLKFYPTDICILNIDADHLDFFKDIFDIRHSFRLFAERLPEGGRLIINGELPDLDAFLSNIKDLQISTYGICREGMDPKSAPYDFCASDITFDGDGFPSYDLYIRGVNAGRIKLSVPGEHNVSNSLAAIAEAYGLGVDPESMKKALLAFKGTHRRFETKGYRDGVRVVDDYAHHPTEIKATLKAAQDCEHKSVWCVFQPHTYTRAKLLRKEFVEALSLADKVVMADIYAAREVNDGTISSADLRDDLIAKGVEAYYFPSFDEIVGFLKKNCVNGDLLITMGAGDIVNVGTAYLKE